MPKEMEEFVPVLGTTPVVYGSGETPDTWNEQITKNEENVQDSKEKKQTVEKDHSDLGNVISFMKKFAGKEVSKEDHENFIKDNEVSKEAEGQIKEVVDTYSTSANELETLQKELKILKKEKADKKKIKSVEDSVDKAKKTLKDIVPNLQTEQKKKKSDISTLEKEIIKYENIVNEKKEQIDTITTTADYDEAHKNYYGDLFGNNEYIKKLIEEIEGDKLFHTALEAHRESTVSQLVTDLMKPIRAAEERGEYTCKYQTLSTTQIYILIHFGYNVVSVVSKKDGMHKDVHGYDYKCSWKYANQQGGGDLK